MCLKDEGRELTVVVMYEEIKTILKKINILMKLIQYKIDNLMPSVLKNEYVEQEKQVFILKHIEFFA